MPILFGVWLRKIGLNSIFKKSIFLGMIMCWLGDILLIYQRVDGVYFILGLSAFLLGHIGYIVAFTRTGDEGHNIALIKRQGWVMVLVFAYGYFFFKRLEPHLGEMIFPVILYTIVICLMLLMAVNRYERVERKSFQLVVIGAILFVASDSILAWNKFVDPLVFSHTLIMSTYGLAQLFIASGAMIQGNNESVITDSSRSV